MLAVWCSLRQIKANKATVQAQTTASYTRFAIEEQQLLCFTALL